MRQDENARFPSSIIDKMSDTCQDDRQTKIERSVYACVAEMKSEIRRGFMSPMPGSLDQYRFLVSPAGG